MCTSSVVGTLLSYFPGDGWTSGESCEYSKLFTHMTLWLFLHEDIVYFCLLIGPRIASVLFAFDCFEGRAGRFLTAL